MHNHFCNFSVKWLIDCTQSNYRQVVKLALLKVYIRSHNYKTVSSNELLFLASGSYKLGYLDYSNIQFVFKTEFKGRHNIQHLFLGHTLAHYTRLASSVWNFGLSIGPEQQKHAPDNLKYLALYIAVWHAKICSQKSLFQYVSLLKPNTADKLLKEKLYINVTQSYKTQNKSQDMFLSK